MSVRTDYEMTVLYLYAYRTNLWQLQSHLTGGFHKRPCSTIVSLLEELQWCLGSRLNNFVTSPIRSCSGISANAIKWPSHDSWEGHSNHGPWVITGISFLHFDWPFNYSPISFWQSRQYFLQAVQTTCAIWNFTHQNFRSPDGWPKVEKKLIKTPCKFTLYVL